MRRFLVASCVLLCLCGCGGSSGGDSGSGSGGSGLANVSGNWNVELTDTGASHPTYTFGLKISQGGDSLTGQSIPYTGGSTYGTSCLNVSDLTAVGNLSGQSVSFTITDPYYGGVILVSGGLNQASNEIQGTFSYPQITAKDITRITEHDVRPNPDTPIILCGGDSGSSTLTLQ